MYLLFSYSPPPATTKKAFKFYFSLFHFYYYLFFFFIFNSTVFRDTLSKKLQFFLPNMKWRIKWESNNIMYKAYREHRSFPHARFFLKLKFCCLLCHTPSSKIKVELIFFCVYSLPRVKLFGTQNARERNVHGKWITWDFFPYNKI